MVHHQRIREEVSRPGKSPGWLCGLVALAAVIAGCAVSRPELSDTVGSAIYSRAELHFDRVELLKPREQGTAGDLAATFAPLIVREVVGEHTNVAPDRVYSKVSTFSVHGRLHYQITYVWNSRMTSVSASKPRWQGVRATLDAHGVPVIWEVLRDSSGAELVFVTQSLEAETRENYGAVLKGRRYAVESGLPQAPEVVVPRVIDDAPAEMGPILYLAAGSGDVRTLICRCMPSQAREVAASAYYDLSPLMAVAAIVPAFPPADSIESKLRLPPDF